MNDLQTPEDHIEALHGLAAEDDLGQLVVPVDSAVRVLRDAVRTARREVIA